MRRFLIAAFAALAAGCANHAQVSGGSGSVSFQVNSGRAALIAVGILAIASEHEREQGHVRSSPLTAFDPAAGRAVPPMDAARKVHEQDCTKPIEDGSANLRCR
ncbi:MAG: hypothetical protein FJY43_05010 [Betaproteobacteria bacterium]|nr:hypothetical protein [Betaproteobacteria bacterium]